LEAIINDLGTEITVALLGLFGVLFAAVFGLIGVLVGQWLNERRHRRDISVKLIDVALGILSGPVRKDDVLREWSVKLLAHYAKEVGMPLGEDAKRDLRDSRLPITYANTVGMAVGTKRADALAVFPDDFDKAD
jgi:hypothetical protein